jgi:putative transposase
LRRPVFAEVRALGDAVVGCLQGAAKHCGIRLYCYCLMADHLHLVVSVEPGGREIAQFVWYLKRLTGRALSDQTNPPMWQRSFYDHVLREAEDLQGVCAYVVQNPVRKGLVQDWEAWGWSWVSPDL